MKKLFTKFFSVALLAVALLWSPVTKAQTTLAVGDLTIIGYNSNGTTTDAFAFVSWVDMTNNTIIKFTDNAFLAAASANLASNARGGENFVIWKNTTGSTIFAGTVVTITNLTANLGTASAGTPTTGLAGLAASGDQIFAYQGAATTGATPDWASNANPTTFNGTILYGLNFNTSTTWLSTGTASSNTSYLPTELNVANGNIAITNSPFPTDAQYTGTRSALGSLSAYKTAVNNPANWTVTTGSVNITLNTTSFVPSVAGATQLAVLSVNGGSSPTQNSPFNVVVESRDVSNLPSSVVANTTVTLTVTTGTGAVGGTFTGTINAASNQVTITGVTYNVAEAGVVLTANATAGDPLTSGASAAFTVLAGASQLVLVNAPTSAFTNNVTNFFTVEARRPDNTVDVSYISNVTLTLTTGTGLVLGTVTKPCVAGIASFNDISFDTPGAKQITASSGALTTAVSGNIVVTTVTLTEDIVPQFMQGKNGTNSNRVPYACRLTISGLQANTTYRYTNQMVLLTGGTPDGPTVAGAGNVIYANPAGFVRTTSAGLSTVGNYGEFTSDGSGNYSGWFVTEPTGNARFTAGNDINMRIAINNGAGGTFTAARLTTTSTIRVLDYTDITSQGTGLRGNSGATPRNFVMVYDNVAGSGRPISGTYVESDGTDNTTANSFALFYNNSVNGVAGAYGMIIPNVLPNGIQRVEQRSISTGAIVGCPATDSDGVWPSLVNTVNPSTGTTAKVLTATDAPLDQSTAATSISSNTSFVCSTGGSATLTVVGGTLGINSQWAWYSGSCGGTFEGYGASIVVSPTVNTTYFVRAEDPCVNTTCVQLALPVVACPTNDNYASAVALPVSTLGSCTPVAGDLTYASSSAEANSTDVTGEDNWYRFVATKPGVRIEVASSAVNVVIELQTAAGVTLDTEDSQTILGNEVLNYTGLTIGQTYKVAVRNYDSSQGTGAYTICIQRIGASGCDYGVGPYTLCNVYKATWAGAGVSYRFDFTQTTSPFSTFTRTQSSDILILSNVPGLQYGYTYSASITALYTLTIGDGSTETLEVPQVSPCTMTLSSSPVTELRVSDRCSNGPRFRGSVVTSLPWVCGVTNWKWKFVELDNSLMEIGIPIEVYRGAASNFINLGTVAALQYGKSYNVYSAPVFSYGDGTYGPAQVMCIIGLAMPILAEENSMSQDLNERSVVNTISSAIYPNPGNGSMFNVNLTGLVDEKVIISIRDQAGRTIATQQYIATDHLNTVISFEKPLASGVYLVNIQNGQVETNHLWMVSR